MELSERQILILQAIEKKAEGIPGPIKDIMSSSAFKGISAAAILATAAHGAKRVEDSLDRRSMDKHFDKLLKEEPELKKLDKFKTYQLYASLWQLNPKMAKDPLTAASFIKAQLEMNMGLHPSTAVSLLQAAKDDKTRSFSSVLKNVAATTAAGGLGGRNI